MSEDHLATAPSVVEIEAVIRIRLQPGPALRFAASGGHTGLSTAQTWTEGLYCRYPRAAPPALLAVPLATFDQEHPNVTAIGKAALSDARWHRMIEEAQSVWETAAAIETDRPHSRFHRLVQVFQLRRRISEAESEQCLRRFFNRHFPVTGAPFRRE